MLTKIGLMV